MTTLLDSLKNYEIMANSAYDYTLAFLIFVFLMAVLKIVKIVIIGRLRKLAKKTKNDFDDTLIEIFGKVKPPFYFFIALYFGVKSLVIPELAQQAIKALFIIVIVYEIIQGLAKLSDYFVQKYLAKIESEEDKEHSQAMVKAASMIVKILLWVLGILIVLANLGINVTSIIASLGIGGIAVALAIQNILSDIFSSFSIYIDKPFKVGDFIVVGADMGNVEKIGLKTTRIRTLQGEELVISNKELTSARIQNFKKMEERRVVFNLGVTYETDAKKLAQIPEIIKNIVDPIQGVEFDRCHFKEYGDFSLNYEVVFFVKSADFAEYMDLRQQINLEIFNQFAKAKIDFAYPTQTLFVKK